MHFAKTNGGMKKIRNRDREAEQEKGLYPDSFGTASACECTGLMHAPPRSEEELESYQELFQMQIPKEKENHRK